MHLAFKILNNVSIQADGDTYFTGITWNYQATFAITEIIFISHGLHLSRHLPEELWQKHRVSFFQYAG